jgi:purine-binding chemotaxis protein CheW
VQHVKGILELPKVFSVPQAPKYIMGVINIDGEVIPLVNAATRLNMNTCTSKEKPSVIILERIHQGKQQRLCLYIDEVQEVMEFNLHELQPLPTSKFEFDERLVNGMFKTESDFVMQINVENFFKHNLEEINSDIILNHPVS